MQGTRKRKTVEHCNDSIESRKTRCLGMYLFMQLCLNLRYLHFDVTTSLTHGHPVLIQSCSSCSVLSVAGFLSWSLGFVQGQARVYLYNYVPPVTALLWYLLTISTYWCSFFPFLIYSQWWRKTWIKIRSLKKASSADIPILSSGRARFAFNYPIGHLVQCSILRVICLAQ